MYYLNNLYIIQIKRSTFEGTLGVDRRGCYFQRIYDSRAWRTALYDQLPALRLIFNKGPPARKLRSNLLVRLHWSAGVAFSATAGDQNYIILAAHKEYLLNKKFGHLPAP